MTISEQLADDLRSELTTLCRCWRLRRRDGIEFGFTDHDESLTFDGVLFRASDGLSARALEQSTGLAVDNSEALGILTDSGVAEEDIIAGRYDGASVEAWLVNWADTGRRSLLFRGEIGEIQRAGGAFKAELRGLTEALNQPQGRIYQSPCSAVLGDGHCRVDLSDARYFVDLSIGWLREGKIFRFDIPEDYAAGWFERGRVIVLSGSSRGDIRVIKNDRAHAAGRTIEVWDAFRGGLAEGDRVRLEAGCDKHISTCRAKFQNQINYRGFPHLPSEDWLMAYPVPGEG